MSRRVFVRDNAIAGPRGTVRDHTGLNPPGAVPTPPNSAPVLASIEGTTLAFTEGDGATAITATLAVSDSDNTTLSSAQVWISTAFQTAEDVLASAGNGTIMPSYNSSTGVLTLTGVDSISQYQTVLRAVTYNNTSQDPDTTNRVISFKVNDGQDDSNTVTRTVSVTGVNDAPVLAGIPTATLSFTEGDGATALCAAATVTDVDDDNLERIDVQITGNLDSGEDVLDATLAGAIGKTWTASTGLLELTGTDTKANYQTVLRSVTFNNTGTPPASTAQRTITFTASDGTDTSTAVNRTVDVAASGSPDLTLTSTDGFEMTVASDGEVTSLKDDAASYTLKSGQKGGFYLHDHGATQTNLFTNGDFESGSTNWSLFSGASIVDESGNNVLQLTSTGGLAQAVSGVISLTPGKSYLLKCRYKSTTGNPDIFVIGQPQDAPDYEDGGFYNSSGGSVLEAKTIQFDLNNTATGQSTWKTVSRVIHLRDSQTGIKLNPKQSGSGTLTLDDFELIDMSLEGDRLTQTWTAGTTELTVSGSDATHDVDISATVTQKADHILVEGTVQSTAAGDPDRTLTLSYNVPIDPTGYTWHGSYDNDEDTAAFTTGKEYKFLGAKLAYNGSIDYFMSPNLTSAVGNGTLGIGLGHHHEKIAAARYVLNDNGLWIKYQFATSNSHKTANTFDFKFVIYKLDDATWGLRDATRKYRDIVPSLFVDRDPVPAGHGCSVFNIKGAANFPTDDPADWGARYDYRGWKDGAQDTKDMQDAGANGCLALTHPNPSEWHIDGTPVLTLSQVHDMCDTTKAGMTAAHNYTWPVTGGTYVQRHSPDSTYEKARQALVNCGMEDSSGEWTYFQFSGSGTLYFLGCCTHPDIAGTTVISEERDWFIDPEIANAASVSADFKGMDYDNMSLVPGRTNRNYRTSHFQYYDTHLSFHAQSLGVFHWSFFSYGEYLKGIAEEMHARTPAAFLTGNIGSEQLNALVYLWCHNAKFGGEFNSEAFDRREKLRMHRQMAGVKCCNIIANTAWPESNLDELFSFCFLYCSWPAILGMNMSSQGTNEFSAADATTLSPYLTILRSLDNAQWQEIPYVTSSDDEVIIERYGTYAGGDLQFVVYNSSSTSKTNVVLTIDRTSLGIGTDSTDWTSDWGSGSTQNSIEGTITLSSITGYRAQVYSVTMASAGITYVAQSTFTTADDNPLTTPHTEEAGSFNVTDTGGHLSITGGELLIPSGTASFGDPGLAGTSHARVAGSWVYYNFDINSYGNLILGFDADGTPGSAMIAGYYITSSGFIYRTASNTTIGPILATGAYELLVVVEADGGDGMLFVKGGIYSGWRMLFKGGASSGATLHPVVVGHGGNHDISEIAFADPDSDSWLPTLCMAWANGSTLTSTGLSGYTGGSGVAATTQAGGFSVTSNRIQSSSSLQSILTWQCGQSDFYLEGTVNAASGDKHGLIFRWVDSNNYWKATVSITDGDFYLYKVSAGVETQEATIAASVAASTDTKIKVMAMGSTIRLMGNGTYQQVTDTAHQTATVTGVVSNALSGVQFDDIHYFHGQQSTVPR